MKNLDKYLIFFVVVVVGLIFWQLYTSRFVEEKISLVGKPAPQFEAKQVGSDLVFRLEEATRNKKVVLVNFWATWCAPCREEIPALEYIYNEVSNENFEIVALMQDESQNEKDLQEKLEKFKKKVSFNFPVYADNENLVAEIYGTFRIPESYLIDSKGNVVEYYVGSITAGDDGALMNRIKQLVYEANPDAVIGN